MQLTVMCNINRHTFRYGGVIKVFMITFSQPVTMSLFVGHPDMIDRERDI